MVLCSVGGVQSQSLTVDRQMRRYAVPRISFINKLDRTGSDPEGVTGQIRSKLRQPAAMVCPPLYIFEHFVGEYISTYPIPLKGLECQASKLVNSDACPRPTTGWRGRAPAAPDLPGP